MPKSVQGKAQQLIHEMYLAPTRKAALAAYDQFISSYQVKFPKACECLHKDKEVLFTFYDFPAQHWPHLRTTNPIECDLRDSPTANPSNQGLRFTDRNLSGNRPNSCNFSRATLRVLILECSPPYSMETPPPSSFITMPVVSALAPNLEIYFKESWVVEPNYTVSVKWLLPGPLVLLDMLQPVDATEQMVAAGFPE